MFGTDEADSFGQRAGSMKANSITARPKAAAGSSIPMELPTRGNGPMKLHTATVYISHTTELIIKGTGRRIKGMAKERSTGPMALLTSAATPRGSNMVRADSAGSTARITPATSRTTSLAGMGPIHGLMGGTTKGTGWAMPWRARECLTGRMGVNLPGGTTRIAGTDRES